MMDFIQGKISNQNTKKNALILCSQLTSYPSFCSLEAILEIHHSCIYI